MKNYLYEYECRDCKETLLLRNDIDMDGYCPYCEGDLDYSAGKIEPIIEYIPRKYF
jgi:Zn finger protein HypA/HybF involved in hydrogenase expression